MSSPKAPRSRVEIFQRLLSPILAVVILIYALKGNTDWGEWRKSSISRKKAAPITFELTEVSAATGVLNNHEMFDPFPDPATAGATGVLKSVGASVAVVDYDADGWPDVYFTNAKPGSFNKMFRNRHDGTFEETAQSIGLADVNQANGSTRALFADLNNDGFKDLLLVSECPRLFFSERGQTFRESTPKSFGCGKMLAGANIADLDNDGRLDIILAPLVFVDLARKITNYNFFPNNLWNATNGSGYTVFKNKGHGQFVAAEAAVGLKGSGWTHAVGVHNIFGNGPDVWFASDFSPDRYFKRDPNGKYTEVSGLTAPQAFNRNGMSFEAADLDNDGEPSVFVSQIHAPHVKYNGNNLWKFHRNGKVENQAAQRGVEACGWAWGAKFADLDNDTRLDLVVGNGFVSSPGQKAGNYFFFTGTLDSANSAIVSSVKSWGFFKKFSWEGFQQSCVLVNGGEQFFDVTDQTSLAGDLSDERGLALIDYRNDGQLSIIMANQMQPSKFYGNRVKNSNSWIGFKLIGTSSNRDAFGARVRIKLKDGRTLTRDLEPMNGYASQSDDRLHFGLGDSQIESISVQWPRGQTQELGHLESGRYHTVTEIKQ